MPRGGNPEYLKRGGLTPGRQQGLDEIARQRERERALGTLAKDDPYAAYDEMHALITRHILQLLRREKRTGKLDSAVTDRLREYRQLTDTLSTYRERKGALEHAAELFTYLDERIANANFCEDSPERPEMPDPEGDGLAPVDAEEPSSDV